MDRPGVRRLHPPVRTSLENLKIFGRSFGTEVLFKSSALFGADAGGPFQGADFGVVSKQRLGVNFKIIARNRPGGFVQTPESENGQVVAFPFGVDVVDQTRGGQVHFELDTVVLVENGKIKPAVDRPGEQSHRQGDAGPSA